MDSRYVNEQTALERRRSYANRRLPSVTLGRSISDLVSSQLPRVLKLEDITIVDAIGQGAFGTVYRVTHRDFSNDLVIKEVLSDAKDNRDALIREVSLLQMLKHPRLLKCVGIITDNQQLYLVTEFMPAGSLHSFILDRPHRLISWQSLISMAIDIASVMAYLHQQGVVHRDLTTHNCLVRNETSVVVSDLGLALLKRRTSLSALGSPTTTECLLPISENMVAATNGTPEASSPLDIPCDSDNGRGGSALPSRSPMSGSAFDIEWRSRLDPRIIILPANAANQRRTKRKHPIAGSTFWMAPEMFASKPYDEAVDVYSFGVILCQMIGRVDADPDVMERWSTTLSVNMESFVRTHAPSDTPAGLLDLAFACTCLSDDERPNFAMCHNWLKDHWPSLFNSEDDLSWL